MLITTSRSDRCEKGDVSAAPAGAIRASFKEPIGRNLRTGDSLYTLLIGAKFSVEGRVSIMGSQWVRLRGGGAKKKMLFLHKMQKK